MFLTDCNKIHDINYNISCCLRHLIEMSKHAQLFTLEHKYSKLLLKTLNHYFKQNKLNFTNLKLEEAKLFLGIMTKYISHFYFLNKYEFAKLLVKIALNASQETFFKEHPDIIIIRCAIYNNLACIYEHTSSYFKALKYSKYHFKYCDSDLDRAVVLNNIARISMRMKDKIIARDTMKNCYSIIKNEANKIISKRMSKSTQIDQNKIELICFLYYNYGEFIETTQNENKSFEIFRKGFKFCLSSLGDFHFTTSKFSSKISKYNNLQKSVGYSIIERNLSSDSKEDSQFDSDLDYMTIIDNNVTLSKSAYKTRNLSHEPEKRLYSFSTNNNLIEKYSKSSISASEINELKTKLDDILHKMENFDMEKIEKLISNKNRDSTVSSKNTKDLNIKPISDISTDSTSKIKNLYDPSMKNIKIRTNNKGSDTVNFTEEMLNEIMNEVEMESSLSNITNQTNSCIMTNDDKRSRNKSASCVNNDRVDKSMINIQPRRKTLKDIFRQVIPSSRLEAIESYQNKTHNNSGIFSQMVSSMNHDIPVKRNSVIEDGFKRKNPLTNKLEQLDCNMSTVKYKKEIESFTNLIEKNNFHANVKNNEKELSEFTINSKFIKPEIKTHVKKTITLSNLNSEVTEENFNNTITNSNSLSNSINNSNFNASSYSINICKDKTDDSYHCSTFYIKTDDKSNKKSDVIENTHAFPKIAIIHDESEDKYECKNLFYLAPSDNSQSNELNFINNQTKNLQSSIKNVPMINLITNETQDKYEFKTFFIKNDKIIDNNLEDDEMKNFLIRFEKEPNLINKKKKKEIDLKKHFEFLITNLNYDEFSNLKVFTIIREVQNELYKIAISYGKNKEGTKGIYMRLFKSNNKLFLTESYLTFEKLRSLFCKIYLYNSLPNNVEISSINTMDLFIEKILIYHCYIIHKENSMQLGVLTRPLGICFNKGYEFKFLNTICLIDIMIIESREVKFFIYNKNNDLMSLQFDWVLDEECFNLLFIEYQSKSSDLVQLDKEFEIKSYHALDESHLMKNGFMSDIIQNIQKIFLNTIKSDNLTFDNSVRKFKSSVFKTNIRDNLKLIDLWIIQLEKNTFEIEFYILRNLSIDNGTIYVNLSHSLTYNDFLNLIGCDYKETGIIMSLKEKLHANYILLNSLKLSRNTNTELILDKFIHSDAKIISEKPTQLFKFNFVADLSGEKEKRNENSNVFHLEYLYFNPLNHFYKLTFFDNTIQKLFSKIFNALPFIGNKATSEEVFEKIPIKDINTPEKNKLLKNAIINFFLNWRKEESFNLFESIDSLLIYLSK